MFHAHHHSQYLMDIGFIFECFEIECDDCCVFILLSLLVLLLIQTVLEEMEKYNQPQPERPGGIAQQRPDN